MAGEDMICGGSYQRNAINIRFGVVGARHGDKSGNALTPDQAIEPVAGWAARNLFVSDNRFAHGFLRVVLHSCLCLYHAY